MIPKHLCVCYGWRANHQPDFVHPSRIHWERRVQRCPLRSQRNPDRVNANAAGRCRG
jgi:hypothetical protein